MHALRWRFADGSIVRSGLRSLVRVPILLNAKHCNSPSAKEIVHAVVRQCKRGLQIHYFSFNVRKLRGSERIPCSSGPNRFNGIRR